MSKNEPERMCVVCRNRFPKGDLERHVRPDTTEESGTDGLIPDPGKTMPGRGYYVCGQARCREKFPQVAKGLMKKRKGDNR